MYYILQGHNYINDIQTISQVFYPNEKFIQVQEVPNDGITVCSIFNGSSCESYVYESGKLSTVNKMDVEQLDGNAVKLSMFNALKEKTNIDTPWGILTGIRPSKIVHGLWDQGYTDEEVKRYMTDNYLVASNKIMLCIETAKAEKSILDQCTAKDISLYIGIPFCPSKCLYCSFTSFPVNMHREKVQVYLQSLTKEMDFVSEYVKKKNLETVYIGGGTPTTLNAEQLEMLLENIQQKFNMDYIKEYTVEAGRPDTITMDKLQVLKKYGVSRISINPQTMNEKTLEAIGRSHTTDNFLKAFEMAKKVGFDNINVDLIIGLPGENPKDVDYTLNEVSRLDPENITVHTLAIKRASRLKEYMAEYSLAQQKQTNEMLEIVKLWMQKMYMHPYYMYRQKNMLGNFENVGYCKSGYEGIYNVQIMEEKQSIIALGAGAITKLVDMESGKIERIFNVKDLDEYINRLDEMLERKRRQLLW